MTYPFLNKAAEVMMLISGQAKAQRLEEVLEGPRDPETFPAQLIAPRDGALTWILDSDAAANLTRPPSAAS